MTVSEMTVDSRIAGSLHCRHIWHNDVVSVVLYYCTLSLMLYYT